MNNKILISAIAVVIVGAGAYFLLPNSSTEPVAGDYRWEFAEVGVDEAGAARTAVSLKSGGTVFSAGTYQGSCFVIDGTTWKLIENEKSGVICWFAGGGREVGVFEEGGVAVVQVGDLDEGSAETPAFRGNFKELFKIEAKP